MKKNKIIIIITIFVFMYEYLYSQDIEAKEVVTEQYYILETKESSESLKKIIDKVANRIELVPYPMRGLEREKYLTYEAKKFKRISSTDIDKNLNNVLYFNLFFDKNNLLKCEILQYEIYKKKKRICGRSSFYLFHGRGNDKITPMTDKEIENTIFGNLLDYAYKFNIKIIGEKREEIGIEEEN